MRSQSASAAAGSSACRSTSRMPGSLFAASISGRVTVPSSRSVPRALPVRSGGPLTSRTSSSSWKASPISAPNSRSALVVAAEQAGALEQARRLQPAAVEVALLADVEVEGVVALGQLAAGERHRGVGEQGDRAGVAGLGEEGEGAREEQVAGGDGALAARGGGDGRQPAAQRRGVEDVVVDQGRHVDQLDRRRGADRRRRRARARRRAGPASAAAACRRRRGSPRRRRRESRRGPRDRPPQQLLDLAQARRQPAAGGVEDRRHRRRNRGGPGHVEQAEAGVTRGCRCGSR